MIGEDLSNKKDPQLKVRHQDSNGHNPNKGITDILVSRMSN